MVWTMGGSGKDDDDRLDEDDEDDEDGLSFRRRVDRLLVLDPLLVGDTGMGLLGSLLLLVLPLPFNRECC